MRTTLDLPDPLMRALKSRAALEGLKLKDYFASIAQAALQRPLEPPQAAKRSALPVFVRADAAPMPRLSGKQLNAILDAQDAGG